MVVLSSRCFVAPNGSFFACWRAAVGCRLPLVPLRQVRLIPNSEKPNAAEAVLVSSNTCALMYVPENFMQASVPEHLLYFAHAPPPTGGRNLGRELLAARPLGCFRACFF